MGDGIRISDAREQAGMSICQLAKHLKLSEDKMISIESDASGISAALAMKISEALGMNIDDICFSVEKSVELVRCPIGVR
jgi:DNA-binding XRE family transcriptional regulator